MNIFKEQPIFTYLRVQWPECLPANPEGGLPLVELLDGVEKTLQPLLLLLASSGKGRR